MSTTDHLTEFRAGWRALAAASLGLGSGMALHPFVINLLAPHLVAAMGWTKAQFAMATVVSGLAILSYPVVGYLADRFGVRRIGGLGVMAASSSYVAIAMLDGPIRHYIAILIVQLTLGAMTTGPVFLRIVVRSFDRGRGMALAIAVSTPAVVAALASTPFARLIETRGWRFAAVVAAIYAASAGIAAILLVPSGHGPFPKPRGLSAGPVSGIRGLFADRRYRILLAVTVLVSMPLVVTNSQLALVLVDNGMTMGHAGSVLALFAFGTIAGRLAAGVAVDRFPAETVGAIAFSLPAIGMLLLAAPFDQTAILAVAILLIGLAFGAEGDVLAYIVSRIFGSETYGAALGMLFAAVGVSAMIGAFILSQTLERWGNYTGFLFFGSASVVGGSALLLAMRRSMAIGAGEAA